MTLLASNETAARAGKICQFCDVLPAQHRVSIKKKGWIVAERRDACPGCRDELKALGVLEPEPATTHLAKVVHLPPPVQPDETLRDGVQRSETQRDGVQRSETQRDGVKPAPTWTTPTWRPTGRHLDVLRLIVEQPRITPYQIGVLLLFRGANCKRVIFDLRSHGFVEKVSGDAHGKATATPAGVSLIQSLPPSAVQERAVMPKPDPVPPTSTHCKEPGCTDKVSARGYCPKHYQKARVAGEFKTAPPAERVHRTGPAVPLGTPPAEPERLLSEELLSSPNGTEGAPSFVVHLGLMRVECATAAEVVALHRALGERR